MYDNQDPVGRAIQMGAKLFAIVADEVAGTYGPEGEAVIRKAVARYGVMRAEEVKRNILRDGRKVTFETAEEYSDYPPNCAWDSESRIEGNTFWELTHKCPFSQAFREIGLERAGSLYCQEIDRAIHTALFGDIRFERPQLFTEGPKAPCEMIVTRNRHS